MKRTPHEQTDFRDLAEALRTNILNTMNCVQVGEIVSYDQATATATVKLAVKRKFYEKTLSYPLLPQCPVFGLNGGNAEAYMPIVAGDACLVLFADKNIDRWHAEGIEATPESSRMHDLADAIALVGIRSLANPPASRTAGEAGIANDAVRVALASNKANIENASKSLLGLIEAFIDVLKALTVTDPVSGVLSLTAASVTALEGQKAEFQALLFKD